MRIMDSQHGYRFYVRIAVVFLLSIAYIKPFSYARTMEGGYGIYIPNLYCGFPEVVDASVTGSIGFHPEMMFQQVLGCRGNPNAKYRTADGTCNHRSNWGSANRPPIRLQPTAYRDGIGMPRTRGYDGTLLPPPTTVSRKVHQKLDTASRFTVMLMQWGQFIDHDITALPITSERNNSIKCCGSNGQALPYLPHTECFPIIMDSYDTNGRFVGNCMEFARSVAARDEHGKILAPREQVNSVTAFIDGSMIYGSSLDMQHELREKTPSGQPGYLLRMSSGDFLPPEPHAEMCMANTGEHCFLAGDSRVNEHPGLAIIHTVFARLHNTLARQLRVLRRRDSHEDIFQVTRKIIIAIIQNIHYSEWLPLIIGKEAQIRHGIDTGFRSPYVPTDNPTISNEFATAAFRFGHSLIPDHFFIKGKAQPLRELFNHPSWLFRDFNETFRSLVYPLSIHGAESMDRFITEEVTGHLFEPEHLGHGRGLDLAALNIQRGRDHGIKPFNTYRQHCGLPPLGFQDFPDVRFEEIYKSPDDIDLFSGLMAERPEPRSLVGPTLSCILGNQFHFLKYGDRFYFETQLTPEGFNDAQLAALRKVTMAHLCCMTGTMETVPRNAFLVPDNYYNYNFNIGNNQVPCWQLRNEFLDLSLWQEF